MTAPTPGPAPRSQALSRRGYLLAVLVPLLIAALGFGAVVLNDQLREPPAGVGIRLPLSGWIPGQDGGEESIQGVLAVDDDSCVYLESTGGDERIAPVWPAGFTARLEDGRLTLVDGSEQEVAQDGDAIAMSGRFESAVAYVGEPCVPAAGEVAVIQSTVSRLGG